jgi:hypothetical protein
VESVFTNVAPLGMEVTKVTFAVWVKAPLVAVIVNG